MQLMKLKTAKQKLLLPERQTDVLKIRVWGHVHSTSPQLTKMQDQ